MNNKNKEALLLYALGMCRAAILDARQGNLDQEESAKIILATSGSYLAKVLKVPESEMVLDWKDYLTDEQILAMQEPE